MGNPSIVFDHIHLISADPHVAASWYVDKLGGEIVNRYDLRGAPQIFVTIGASTLIVRGQRTGEQAGEKHGLQWGMDHFGFQVHDDFDAYCATLKEKGVSFTLEPTTFNPTTRIAYIAAPDGVSIELVHRTG
jgi:catechol 2,3-dioxygenase-like lactoylglutathione lyase family enzyme